MTPEEIARMQAGVDPRAYYQDYDILRKVRAGELPEELLGNRGATTIRPGTTGAQQFNASSFFENMMNRMGGFGKNFEQNLEAPGGLFKNKEGAYRRAGGGKTGAVLGAVETTLQDPIAGIVSAPIGLAAGQATNMLTNALTKGLLEKGPLPVKAAGMALRYLAPSFVGYQAQQAAARGVQGITGSAPEAAQGATQALAGGGGLLGLGSNMQDLSLDLPILGKVNIGERAKMRSAAAFNREMISLDQQMELDRQQKMNRMNMTNEIEYMKAAGQIDSQNRLNYLKSMQPIIERAQRNELAANQAMMNTQIAGAQSLARMSGMFQLADRSKAEEGALARTLAANSPYNAAMLPMPQIQFGG